MYNVYVFPVVAGMIYDVSIPEIFPDQIFSIMGPDNVIAAIHESCEIVLESPEFNLQIFCNQEVLSEISDF